MSGWVGGRVRVRVECDLGECEFERVAASECERERE